MSCTCDRPDSCVCPPDERTEPQNPPITEEARNRLAIEGYAQDEVWWRRHVRRPA